MSTEENKPDRDWTCAAVCSGIACLGGVLVGVMVTQFADFSFSGAVFVGIVAALLGSWVLSQSICGYLDPPKGPGNIDAAPEPKARTSSASSAPASSAGGTSVKSGNTLPGEKDLAGRKGEWSYKANGTAVGHKPEGLSAPRAGQPDDLKQIKGVGPKLEAMLNGMGFYHFDQIASWTDEEVAWVDENLEGFKGRVTRDDWIVQAKSLAGGSPPPA